MKNRVQLVGNLGQDPEIRVLEQGKVARISLATNEVYKNKQGETVKNTEWHTVIIWNKLAELAEQKLRKGTEISIEGKLVNKVYEDKNGQKRHQTEILARELLIISRN